jgi:glycosyltransferase involved in cell wall biosynthesis
MRAMAALAPDDEFVCYGDRRAFDALGDAPPNVRRLEVEQAVSPTIAASADGNRSPRDMLRLTRAVARSRLDVFFSPTVYTFFPLPLRLPAVVTIHDTIAERFPHLTLPSARARLFWRLKVALAIRQARLVLTVSHHAARSIADVLGVKSSRIRVALEAPAEAYRPSSPSEISAAAARQELPAGASWFVYVGGFNPHKRVDCILRAHAALLRELPSPPHLLLVGSTTSDVFFGEVERLRALVRELGTEAHVRWAGFVPDEELRHLHSGALSALLPSECEGFGLPAVEAAACGAPVIATLESPLPELLDGGGVFVRPGDVDALTAAMRLVATDDARRHAFGQRALERARALTWPACARAALGAIREAAA